MVTCILHTLASVLQNDEEWNWREAEPPHLHYIAFFFIPPLVFPFLFRGLVAMEGGGCCCKLRRCECWFLALRH
jgi:hypothetical protein